jgi:hypothetical protein
MEAFMAHKSKRHGDEFWSDHIKRWEASGKSRKQYCKETDISYWTFRERQKRIQDAHKSGKTLVRVPLKITDRSQDGTHPIELLINESIRIRIEPGFDGKLLRAVIQELGAVK